MKKFQILSKPKEIYREMLRDIASAKKQILLETHIFANDPVGKEFTDALTEKAKQGVKVYLLIDAYHSKGNKLFLNKIFGSKGAFIGSYFGVDKEYFKELIKYGGEVRFFKEIQVVLRIFSQNHERNHRKLLIIDNHISYVGSINITKECLDWRELAIRLEGEVAEHFRKSFFTYWKNYGKFTRLKLKTELHKGFEIIQDLPKKVLALTAQRYVQLVDSAKKEILIETPYFIPPISIRNALYNAVKRGIKVKLLIPYNSDMGILDLVRNRYLGRLYQKGISIYYYMPSNLHSKLLIIDDKFFLLGSSNLDYRSFLHDHQINLIGTDKNIIAALKQFFNSGLKQAAPFDYGDWKNRSSLLKIAELIGLYVREYL